MTQLCCHKQALLLAREQDDKGCALRLKEKDGDILTLFDSHTRTECSVQLSYNLL